MAERPASRAGVLGWLSTACDALASVFLPGGCRLCDTPLVHASRVPICSGCLSSFARISEDICGCCGMPLESMKSPEDQGALCAACRMGLFAFSAARSFAVYEKALVRAILLLKFERIEPLGGWFAGELAELVHKWPPELAADIVVPVPLHRQRLRERGYNQAEMISRPLARKLGLPHRPLLERTKPRPDKHLLTLRERWDSVRGAFATRPSSQVDNLRVLLVDDVMTTGATLDACAKVLRHAGAKAVVGLTVARAERHPLWTVRT